MPYGALKRLEIARALATRGSLDAMALAGVTDQIVYLDEGDVVDLQIGKTWVAARGENGRFHPVERPVRTVQAHSGAAELGPYRHYMQKEIFEQPRAVADTLEGIDGISPALRASTTREEPI